MRSEMVLETLRTALEGDRPRAIDLAQCLRAEEAAAGHQQVAAQLDELIVAAKRQPSVVPKDLVADGTLWQIQPQRTLDSLILPPTVVEDMSELESEYRHADGLAAGLLPRNKILLVGPPGCGKTSLAEALASVLGRPLLTARFEGVVRSLLGETSAMLGKMFEYVSHERCVLFIDEFETLAAERGRKDDVGEMSRVVAALLLQLDSLPKHVLTVVATNHAEMLDRAVWRRFQMRLTLPGPDMCQAREYLLSRDVVVPDYFTFWNDAGGLSWAELEEFVWSVKRMLICDDSTDPQAEKMRRAVLNAAVRQQASASPPIPEQE